MARAQGGGSFFDALVCEGQDGRHRLTLVGQRDIRTFVEVDI